jgi:hypothetical protein
MEKLSDYSKVLIPELRLEDFSQDTLAEIARLYAKLFLGLDGLWYRRVRDRFGEEGALICDAETWEDIVRYETVMIRRYLKIKGNDLAALLKTTQLSPWFQLTRSHIELKDKNSAVLTVNYCPTVDALENKGEGSENRVCQSICPKIYQGIAALFSPNISVKCLKTLPRKSKDDVCCQWEYHS